MMTLRDSLRSGDIWVEGSRAFRAFGDFLLPPEAFVARRQEDELGLAVADRFDDWRAERTALLEARTRRNRCSRVGRQACRSRDYCRRVINQSHSQRRER